MERALPRRDTAPVTHRMFDRGLLPEGIAHDPSTGTLYVTSTRRGSVTAIDRKGIESTFVAGDGVALLGAARRSTLLRAACGSSAHLRPSFTLIGASASRPIT